MAKDSVPGMSAGIKYVLVCIAGGIVVGVYTFASRQGVDWRDVQLALGTIEDPIVEVNAYARSWQDVEDLTEQIHEIGLRLANPDMPANATDITTARGLIEEYVSRVSSISTEQFDYTLLRVIHRTTMKQTAKAMHGLARHDYGGQPGREIETQRREITYVIWELGKFVNYNFEQLERQLLRKEKKRVNLPRPWPAFPLDTSQL